MLALIVIAYIPIFIGHIWLIALAFREHILWGVVCLFVPFATFIFAFMNWQVAKKAFLVELSGVGLAVLAAIVVPLGKKPTEEAKTETSVVTTSAPAPYTPPPAYTPPPKPARPVAAPEPEVRMIEQVYADNATNLYYSEKCKRRPENTIRVAKSIALRQGFTEAPCP